MLFYFFRSELMNIIPKLSTNQIDLNLILQYTFKNTFFLFQQSSKTTTQIGRWTLHGKSRSIDTHARSEVPISHKPSALEPQPPFSGLNQFRSY